MPEWTRNQYNLIDYFGNVIFINFLKKTQYPLWGNEFDTFINLNVFISISKQEKLRNTRESYE